MSLTLIGRTTTAPNSPGPRGLLQWVEGVGRARDLIRQAIADLEGGRAKWAILRTDLIRLVDQLNAHCPRGRLTDFAARLRCYHLFMPAHPCRTPLLEAAHLLYNAPDYSRIVALNGRCFPWPPVIE